MSFVHGEFTMVSIIQGLVEAGLERSLLLHDLSTLVPAGWPHSGYSVPSTFSTPLCLARTAHTVAVYFLSGGTECCESGRIDSSPSSPSAGFLRGPARGIVSFDRAAGDCTRGMSLSPR